MIYRVINRELNAKSTLKQKADEDLRKCRRLLSTFRVELQQAKKELKEKEEQSALAEEDIKRYTAENSKLQEKLKTLTESISSPSGDPRNSALSRLLNESPAPTNLRMSNLINTPSTPCTPLPSLKMKSSNVTGTSKFMLSSQNISQMRPKLSNPEEEETSTSSSSQRKETRKAEGPPIPVDPESLKFKRMKVDPVPSSSGYFYDGFGGHSKPDIFPKGASGSSSRSTGLSKGDGSSKKTRGPVTMKIKGKTQTTTLDYFYSQ